MIHSTSNHNDVTASDEQKKKWNTYNLELFEQQREHYFLDKKSCIHLKHGNKSSVGWYEWIMDNIAGLQQNLQSVYSPNLRSAKIQSDDTPQAEMI